MDANPYDQFDPAPTTPAPAAPPTTAAAPAAPVKNPYDQFDAPAPQADATKPPQENLGAEFAKGLATGLPSMLSTVMPGSESAFNTALTLLHANPNDYFPTPTTLPGRLARAGGEGAIGMLLPGGEERGFARIIQMGKDMLAGTIGGVTAQGATEVAPEPLKPAAGLVGGLVGGTLGLGAMEVPGMVKQAATRASDYLAPAIPGNTEKLAASKLGDIVTDRPAAIEALNPPTEIVPGSKPTSFQASGDTGLGTLERVMARSDPNFKASLLGRLDEQNAARVSALENVTDPANPAAVADYFKLRMQDLESRGDALYSDAQKQAQDAYQGLGDQSAADTGAAARQALEARRKALNTEANHLWDSIDPNKDLNVTTGPLVRSTAKIYGTMGPEEMLSMTPGEKALAGIIGTYGSIIPFQRFKQLRTAINAAMSDAKRAGQNQAYGRLTQLRSSVEDAVHDSIAGKVAEQQQGVAAGQMSEDDTLAANFLRQAKEWYAQREGQTGAGVAAGNGVPEAGGPAAVPRPAGTASPPSGGPAGAPGVEGLPQNDHIQPSTGALSGQGNQPAGGEPRLRTVPGTAADQRGDQGGYLAGREPDGSLVGLPRRIGNLTASVHPEGQRVAADYMKKAGLDYAPPKTYAKVDPARAKRIADAYDAMAHDPRNPEVRRAYDAMVKETLDQYQAMLDAGMKIEFIPKGAPDPYNGNPRNMTEDVRNNHHMWVFPTDGGFGSDAKFDPSENPLLAPTPYKISGRTATANDIFRAVHDYFGHVKEGVGFRADGEENAWRSHSAMYSPLARKAMTSETRGQNSWVNFGPYGEHNRTAKSEDTHYADQKVGLLPDWAIHEGAGDPGIASTTAERFAGAGRPELEASALGAINDAVYTSLAKRANMTPEELQQKFPLPGVQKAETAPTGALYQSGEYHPVTAFIENGTLKPRGYHPDRVESVIPELQSILKDAYDRSGGNVDQIPLMIDNERDLYDRAKKLAEKTGKSEGFLDQNGGVGRVLYRTAEALAPDKGAWRAHTGNFSRASKAPDAQAPTAPTFYSATQKAVEASKNNKATPDQWLATLRNTPGVKQEELDWLGLEPWLKQQSGAVSKEDMTNFIRDNSLEVSETDLSGLPADESINIDWNPVEPEDEYLKDNIYPGTWAHDKAKEDLAQELTDEQDDPEADPVSVDDINDDDPRVMDKALEYERDSYNSEPEYSASVQAGGIDFSLNKNRDDDGVEIYDGTNNKSVTDGFSSRLRDDADITQAIREYLAENGQAQGEGTKFYDYAEHGGEDYHELLLKLPERIDQDRVWPHPDVTAKYKPQWDQITARMYEIPPPPKWTPEEKAEYGRLSDEQDALHQRMVAETVAQHPGRVGKSFTRSHWDDPNVVAHVRFDTRNVGGKRTLFLQELQSDWHQQGREKGYTTPDFAQKREAAQQRLEAAQAAYQAAEKQYIAEHANGRNVDRYDIPRELTREVMAARIEGGEGSDRHVKAVQARQNEIEDWKKFLETPAAKEMQAASAEHERLDPYNVVPDAPFKTSWPDLILKRMIRWGAEHGYDQIAWTPGDLQNGELVTQGVSHIDYVKKPDGSYRVEGIAPQGWNISGVGKDVTLAEIEKTYGKKVADQIAAGEGRVLDHSLKTLASANGEPFRTIRLPEGTRIGGDIQYYYGKALPALASKIVKKFGVEPGRAPMKLGRENISAVTIPINDKMRETALNTGFPLFQRGQRGAIQFSRNGASLISMLRHADASTGAHELGHHYLEMLKGIAEHPEAPAGLRDDWNAVKSWWKSNAVDVAKDAAKDGVTADHVRQVLRDGSTGDASIDAAVDRGFHEQWARAFESYLRDGQAPTSGLKRVFEQFKQWLTQVYRSVTQIGVNVSPEMKGVFDRMLGAEAAKPNGPRLIDKAAADRFARASAATRNMKETFGAKPVASILKRPGGNTMPYGMTDEGVSSALWRPGAEGAAHIKAVLNAAPEARPSIEQAAVQSLKRAASKDGTIDPQKLAAWRAKHTDALSQVPSLDRRLSDAAKATEAMVQIGAKRAAVATAVQKTAIGKLLKVSSDADVTSTVGAMLGKADAVRSMRELVAEAKNDPDAMAGLQRAVVDHMIGRLKSSKDALRSDSFQRFLGKNAPALSEVLRPEQMNSLRAIAQDLKRASRDVRAPGGGSDTAENLANRQAMVHQPTLLGKIFRLIMDSGVGTAIGLLTHPLAGLASAIGSFAVQSAREKGLKRVDDLIKEAILDPDLMRTLLMKAPAKRDTGSHRTLGHQLTKLAIFTANRAKG